MSDSTGVLEFAFDCESAFLADTEDVDLTVLSYDRLANSHFTEYLKPTVQKTDSDVSGDKICLLVAGHLHGSIKCSRPAEPSTGKLFEGCRISPNLAELSETLCSEPDRVRVAVSAPESPIDLGRGNSDTARTHEWIRHYLFSLGTLTNQNPRYLDGLLRGIATTNPWGRYHVGDPKIVETPLTLLEKQDELVASPVVIAHADGLFIPDKRLPEAEPGALSFGLRYEHRLCIAEQIEVGIPPALTRPPGLSQVL